MFEKAKNDEKVRDVIEKNYGYAKELGLQGTPALIIGGQFVGGMISADQIESMLKWFNLYFRVGCSHIVTNTKHIASGDVFFCFLSAEKYLSIDALEKASVIYVVEGFYERLKNGQLPISFDLVKQLDWIRVVNYGNPFLFLW